MATSDEVWARGCPPRTNRRHLHILASPDATFECLRLAKEFGFDTTVAADISEPDDEAFAHELRSLENCTTLIFELDQSGRDWIFSVGYAVARGKTIIGIGQDLAGMFRLKSAAYIIDDLKELEGVLKGLSRSG